MMNIPELKQRAGEALQKASYDPKLLILIHAGATWVLTFLVNLVTLLLDQGIGQTGGLSGIGFRSVLTTAQTVLSIGQVFAVTFWQAGWLAATLKIWKAEPAFPRDLLTGFHRFGPLLRLILLQWLVIFGMSLGFSYFAIFAVTVFLPVFHFGTTVSTLVLPIIVVCLLLALIIPIFYRLRLAQYFILDGTTSRAASALRMSSDAMNGHSMELFRVDLHFWWFYLLELMAAAISALPMLVEEFFFIDAGWAGNLLCLLLSCVLQLVLYGYCKPKIDVTYVACYETLTFKPAAQELPPQEFYHEAD